jgi:hypothetical protein
MMGQIPEQAVPLIPPPELTLPALRAAVAKVVPGHLPEMFEKMQAAFVRAGEEGSVVPIHMFTGSGPSSSRSSGTQTPPGDCTLPNTRWRVRTRRPGRPPSARPARSSAPPTTPSQVSD